MKTNKTFAYGFLTVILALAFFACDNEKTPESNPPVANAQAEPTHTLADNLTITLDGTDSTGNISAYAWECETYTADQGTVSAEYTTAQVNALITNAGTATATVKPRKAGTYVFKLTVTGNDSESDTDTVSVVVEGLSECTVEFVPLGVPDATINFSPSATLPSGVTYTITDNSNPQKSWNSGQITASEHYNNDSVVTFTQTFYLNGTEITSTQSKRTVVVVVSTFPSVSFTTLNSDSGSVTLKWTELP
jgi:hypothetical protein